jgi:hypothetical protein
MERNVFITMSKLVDKRPNHLAACVLLIQTDRKSSSERANLGDDAL